MKACLVLARARRGYEIYDSGIPIYFRVLMWFIRRVGKSSGNSYLARVKVLAEGIAA
jgi:hypothetical protein